MPFKKRYPLYKNLILTWNILFLSNQIKEKILIVCSLFFYILGKIWPKNTQYKVISDQLIYQVVFNLNDIKIKIPDISLLYSYLSHYSGKMINILNFKVNDIFIDVGANIGWYTLNAAKQLEKGQVFAIEAEPANFRILKDNIDLNNFKNVISYNIAAWNKNTNIKLMLSKSYTMHTVKEDFITNRESRYSKRTMIIEAKKLDDIFNELDLAKLDVVKIDVEGAEIEVIDGMKKYLSLYNPRIIVESYNRNEMRVYMKKLGYNRCIEYKDGTNPPDLLFYK